MLNNMPNNKETMEEIDLERLSFVKQQIYSKGYSKGFKEGSAHLGEEKRKAYQLGYEEGQEEEAIRHQKEDLKGYAEGRASMAEEVREEIVNTIDKLEFSCEELREGLYLIERIKEVIINPQQTGESKK